MKGVNIEIENMSYSIQVIVTQAEGTMNVYGLPKGQGLDRRNDITRVAGEERIIPAALAPGQSINLHSAQN